MTDRHSAYIFILDRDIREDDAQESILVALQMIKGVLNVKPVVTTADMMIAEERARSEMRKRLLAELNREGPK